MTLFCWEKVLKEISERENPEKLGPFPLREKIDHGAKSGQLTGYGHQLTEGIFIPKFRRF